MSQDPWQGTPTPPGEAPASQPWPGQSSPDTPAPATPGQGPQPWQQARQVLVLAASPMGVGDVFTSAFRALGRCLGLGVLITLAQVGVELLLVGVLVGAVVAVAAATGQDFSSRDMSAATVTAIVLASLLGVVGMVAANVKFSGMLTCAVEQVARGLRPSWQSTHRATRGIVRRSLPLMGLGLGALLAVFFFAVLCIAVLGDRAGGVVMVLGLLVLGVIGVYVMVRWQFTLQALAVESRGGIDALRRSFDLTRGRFWPILGTLVLLQLIPNGIGNLVSCPAGRSGDATLALVLLGVDLVISMLVGLWSSAAMTVMYIDHVLRRALVERFGPSGRPPLQPWPGQQLPAWQQLPGQQFPGTPQHPGAVPFAGAQPFPGVPQHPSSQYPSSQDPAAQYPTTPAQPQAGRPEQPFRWEGMQHTSPDDPWRRPDARD